MVYFSNYGFAEPMKNKTPFFVISYRIYIALFIYLFLIAESYTYFYLTFKILEISLSTVHGYKPPKSFLTSFLLAADIPS